MLRKGKWVGTIDAAEATKASLAQMMVGREVIFESIRKEQTPGKFFLKWKVSIIPIQITVSV